MEGAACELNIINNNGSKIIHFHDAFIQSAQNWKSVVLNWLTCFIWPCRDNQRDTHEYSPMYMAIFEVR